MNYTFSINSTYGKGNTQALSTVKSFYDDGLERFDEYTFDFSHFRETNPFNILLIANAINEFCDGRKKECRFSIIPKNDGDFLSHLGFYDLINVNYGKKIGEAVANSNYVPITKITFEGNFYDRVEAEARKLARVLNFDKELSAFLQYAFLETIRNTYEHAETQQVYVCAQKWPSKNEVEIAIVDCGCGIAHAMNKRFKNKTEKDLAYLALRPGITIGSNHSYLPKGDYWLNSGYGLYILKELAPIYRGSFLLCSGGIALLNSKTGVREFSTSYQGTAIAIRIRTDLKNNFVDIRKQVVKQGQAEAHSIKGAVVHASKSSGGFYG